ncbi:unnamed protein product [Leptosia nina]|uniref:Uncharacterized protein n=1 Tax=Leptosia nina TaxID=320188 RepID=A0AAV1JPK3_9NEOP
MWLERWEAEKRGRDLQRFFPCVRGSLRASWVSPDYVTSQLLAGHGAFNGRLREMVSALELDECGPVYFGDLVASEGNFAAIRKFASAWHARRSEMEKEK